jgi:hypothetical protein
MLTLGRVQRAILKLEAFFPKGESNFPAAGGLWKIE